MSMDELMRAFQGFSTAAKEYGATQGIRDATEAVNQIKQQTTLDYNQRAQLQNQVAQQLQGGLAALGAPATQIAQAVGSIQAPQIKSSADALALAQSSTDPQERATLLKQAKDFSQLEGDQTLAIKKPVMQQEQDYAKELLAMRLGADRGSQRDALTANQAMQKAERDAQLELPGFVLAGKTRPLPAEAQKLRDGLGTAKLMYEEISQLKSLVANKGSFEVGGSTAGEMQSLATGIRLRAKEAEELGVLNGKDYQIITELIPETGNISALFTSDKTALKKLDIALQRAQNGVRATTQARGYESEAILTAKEWLKQNPTDPRASAVRDRIKNFNPLKD